MNHLPTLISDLAVILLSAGIITLLFKAIKQPVVLGYIIAGIIAGPSLNIFHVADIQNIKTWADIGVIFLLFSLGLDFSFKKLFHIGGTAFITAITVVIGMLTLGYLTGKVLGWSHINCMFLGGMLAMSSTTIIIKSFEDMGLRNQLFAGLVIGVLIVEDLVAVVLMVLLSTISVSKEISGWDMIFNILRLGMFILIWFISGIYLLPTFLKKAKKWLNDETLLVISLALCLGMVILATKIGFSAALGAFVMGSLLAETLEAERIEHLTRPVKNLFGAIFFVSVGMMINPFGLTQYWLPIMLITFVVVFGQITFGFIGMLLSGQTLKVAIQSGFSLAQVGEFAFIIASLGISLKVTDAQLYPIIVAVSVLTTFLTPFLIRLSEPAYKRLVHILPASWLKAIQKLSFTPQLANTQSIWAELIKDLTRVVLTYLAITITIIFLGLRYVDPLICKINNGVWGHTVSAFVIILAMAPFLRAIMVKKNKTIRTLLQEQDMNKGPLISLMILRILLCIGLVMYVLGNFFQFGWTILFLIAFSVIAFTMFSNWLKRGSINIETRFLSNLTARQKKADSERPMRKEFVRHLLSRDIHLAEFEIHPHSPNVGKPLREIHMREHYGVNIVSIIRGDDRINIPGGSEFLYPHDRIVVVGTDKQLMKFNYSIDECISERDKDVKSKKEVFLEQILLDVNSHLVGKTISTAKLRDKYNCMVIGIERGRSSKMNPDVTEDFRPGDILWLVGERQKIKELVEDHK